MSWSKSKESRVELDLSPFHAIGTQKRLNWTSFLPRRPLKIRIFDVLSEFFSIYLFIELFTQISFLTLSLFEMDMVNSYLSPPIAQR